MRASFLHSLVETNANFSLVHLLHLINVPLAFRMDYLVDLGILVNLTSFFDKMILHLSFPSHQLFGSPLDRRLQLEDILFAVQGLAVNAIAEKDLAVKNAIVEQDLVAVVDIEDSVGCLD